MYFASTTIHRDIYIYIYIYEKHNLIKRFKLHKYNIVCITRKDVIKINLFKYTIIGWKIWTYPIILKKKKHKPQFLGTHVTCYIKFKLLYKYRIVTFFFLSKYKYKCLYY